MASQNVSPTALAVSMLKSGVAISKGRVVVQSSTTDSTCKQAVSAGDVKPIGIAADEAAAADAAAAVYPVGQGTVLGVSGAAVTIDALVSFDADGKIIDATTGKFVIGTARTGVGAANLWVQVELGNLGVVKA